MNFIQLFFHLLITNIFYKRTFCQDPEIEYAMQLPEVIVWGLPLGYSVGTFSSVHFSKAVGVDGFLMYDTTNPLLFDDVLDHEPFRISQLEISRLYELKLSFLLRKDDALLCFICQFLNAEDVQKFFRSVDSMKQKMRTVNIEGIARCTMPEKRSRSVPPTQITHFADQATLSVRNIYDFSSRLIRYSYHISPTSNEASLIFTANNFSRSVLLNRTLMALCVEGIPDEIFLIRFSDKQDSTQFADNYMPKSVQNDTKCTFPHVTSEEIDRYMPKK